MPALPYFDEGLNNLASLAVVGVGQVLAGYQAEAQSLGRARVCRDQFRIPPHRICGLNLKFHIFHFAQKFTFCTTGSSGSPSLPCTAVMEYLVGSAISLGFRTKPQLPFCWNLARFNRFTLSDCKYTEVVIALCNPNALQCYGKYCTNVLTSCKLRATI